MTRRRLAAAGAVGMLAAGLGASTAAAQDARGIDPNQGDALVEVHLENKGAALRLQLDAEKYGVEFNDHYLRRAGGSVVVATVFGSASELQALEDAGYELGSTIEGPATWRERRESLAKEMRKEERAEAAVLGGDVVTALTDEDELVVLRADYFENYAGRFLSVEAKTRLGGSTPTGATYTGPTLSLAWNTGPGTEFTSTTPARTLNVNIDPDTTPDTYIEHRDLVRIGDVDGGPPAPTRIRIGSSTGATIEADVTPWLAGGLPPHPPDYQSDFTTRYMDPTEVYARFESLADEFSNIAELVELPYETNGYQRRAQATMHASATAPSNPGSSVGGGAPETQRAVVLTSTAWGHEGGNDLTAEFVDPGAADQPLRATMDGDHLTVSLATDASGALVSTAAQVADAINANAAARAKLVARTYRGLAGSGIVRPRASVGLSDYLSTSTNAHVPRGPFKYSAMRIGKHRNGSKVGVFLYCQQHAREWATPLTCLETAERLLRNYAIDRETRTLVDTLDIFILPSSNPDGSHFSIHNFTQQRRNLTNHCVVGGKETDDTAAADYWTLQTGPGGVPYTINDPAGRQAWGVDLNRNNTFGTLFDTFGGLPYIGASPSCISDVFSGPSEASEPEIQNELWIADTFPNIKFSNNIHSFGGYFMWAPGTYLSDRGEGDAVHANIGVEKYFFEAGDRILNRIKDVRNTVILPERTGPIADVLYSAAGNSADEHWYNRGVIAYSFETGADRYGPNTLSNTAPAGQAGFRIPNGDRVEFGEGDVIVFEKGTANEETAIVDHIAEPNTPNNPQGNPNVFLTAPLTRSHAAGTTVEGPTTQVAVGFQPDYATEGKFEALEFADGNYGLLESALAYSKDDQAPVVRMTGPTTSSGPIDTTFEWVNEPSVIRYTTDGSLPNDSSPVWDSTGPREPGQVFHLTRTTTFRWVAEDIKGNTSRGQQRFTIR